MSVVLASWTMPRDGGRPVPPPQGAATDAGPPTAQTGSRVLVVEDNYFVALTIENALTDAGYEVLAVVASGEEALEYVRDEPPQLVIMDIRLAGEMDGIEAAIALRALGITCLMASAHSDEAMKRRAAEARPAGWLVKPFPDADLVGAVGNALRQQGN